MSVKDQLEQHHVDGDHTTVKSKRSTNTGVVSEFNKEAAWQAQQYGGYAGEFCGSLFTLCSLYSSKFCLICTSQKVC